MAHHRNRVRHHAGRSAAPALLIFLILQLGSSPRAAAQSVSGVLRDVDTDAPISVGVITLLDIDRKVLHSTVSDANGFWQLRVPRAGVYFISAERLGYQSWTAGPLSIDGEARLNSVFHLRRAPLALDPIEARATAMRRYLESAGFFERQRGNFGHFVSPEDVDRRQAARVTDLLIGIPGVQRVALTGGSVGPAQIQLRGSSLSQGGLCRPRVYVDGLVYSRGDSRPVRLREGDATERATDDEIMQRLDQALSLDDIGHPSIIAGIEVYRSASQVPVQFGGASVETLCGVIVIWTRTGRMRAGER